MTKELTAEMGLRLKEAKELAHTFDDIYSGVKMRGGRIRALNAAVAAAGRLGIELVPLKRGKSWSLEEIAGYGRDAMEVYIASVVLPLRRGDHSYWRTPNFTAAVCWRAKRAARFMRRGATLLEAIDATRQCRDAGRDWIAERETGWLASWWNVDQDGREYREQAKWRTRISVGSGFAYETMFYRANEVFSGSYSYPEPKPSVAKTTATKAERNAA